MKPAVRRTTLAVDVVVLSPRVDALAVLLVRAPAGSRERWSLPWDAPQPGEGLEDAAARIAQAALGSAPAFFEQVGALSDGRRHPGEADVSVGIAALYRPTLDHPSRVRSGSPSRTFRPSRRDTEPSSIAQRPSCDSASINHRSLFGFFRPRSR